MDSRRVSGVHVLRTLVDKYWSGSAMSTKLSAQLDEDLRQRLLLNFFGWTVIGQLWIWPLLLIAMSQSLAIAAAVVVYMIWILWGPGRKAAQNEKPYHAPWRHLPVWRHMADYFNAQLIKTSDLNPQGRYIFAAYPHGITAISGWIFFATEACGFSRLFPGLRPWCLTLASNFKCPGLREYCMMYGLRSCERGACISMLKKPGSTIILFPGGAAEALVMQQGQYNLILRRRKGFARLALQSGASLVPVFCFGETDLFETYLPPQGSWVAKMQQLSHRFWGTSQPLFRGNGVFTDWGLLPFRRQLSTVVGAPIPVQKMDPREVGQEAFDDAVEQLHAKYVAALQALFDDWKGKLASQRRGELNIL